MTVPQLGGLIAAVSFLLGTLNGLFFGYLAGRKRS